MQNRPFVLSCLIASGTLSLLLTGCGEDASSDADGDLVTIEAELNAARGSRGAASTEARACFEAYRSCTASADECRAQLKACLPERAPAPEGCSSAGDAATPAVDASAPTPAPAANADASTTADAGAGGGRGARDRPSTGNDGGARDDVGGDRGGDRGDRGRGQADRCRKPDLSPGSLGGCRDRAVGAVAQGTSADAAAGMHDRCVRDSFDASIGKLCSKARDLCASASTDASAQTQICTAIAQACSGFADAGP